MQRWREQESPAGFWSRPTSFRAWTSIGWPKRRRKRIWSDAYWTSGDGGSGGGDGGCCTIGEPSSALKLIPGTRHVPDRITGRDGKFPVFPEQLTRRDNTCSQRYRVYIPTRSVATFLRGEKWGQPLRRYIPSTSCRTVVPSPDFVARCTIWPAEYLSTLLPAASGCCTQQRLVCYWEWTCMTTLAHLPWCVGASHFPVSRVWKTNLDRGSQLCDLKKMT